MDILIFAAIAFFVFFKLNKQLGQVDEEEKKNIQDKIRQKKTELKTMQSNVMNQVKTAVDSIDAKISADAKLIEHLDEQSKENIIKILKSSNINAGSFLDGAKSAFEMTIKAFSAGDLKTLENLLSNKIYQGFESAITQRQESGNILTTNVIAVEDAQIISAMMLGDYGSITVKIHSKQINYVCDVQGNVIDGSKESIAELDDVWTFKRDLTLQNPNWTVFATSSN